MRPEGIFTALLDEPDPVAGTPYTVKWKYKIGNFVRQSSPAIDQNGIIYFGDLNGYVYAFEDKGACPDNGTLRTQPARSSSCTNGSQGGPVLLGRQLIGSVPGITASPVISADSNTLYVGTNTGLKALDIRDPERCWATPPLPGCAASPVLLWTFTTTGKVDQTPALGRDGTLYVPVMNFGQKSLYAVKPDGKPDPKWVFGPINTGSETSAYPIVAGDNKVYVSLGNTIYALDPNTGTSTTPPTLLWKYATTNFLQSSPLIGPVTGSGSNKRAVLYVPGRDTNLYAISSGLSGRPDNFTPTTCWADSDSLFQHGMSLNRGRCFQRGVSLKGDGWVDHRGQPQEAETFLKTGRRQLRTARPDVIAAAMSDNEAAPRLNDTLFNPSNLDPSMTPELGTSTSLFRLIPVLELTATP